MCVIKRFSDTLAATKAKVLEMNDTLDKRVGIQKANIPVERIASLFKPLRDTTNVFLPTEFRQYLENDN